jgi:hypothetical protein|tara:strand:+ start:581 stop:790 length:210 start_codon:yes stop_codon:yes gene_type:complete
MTRAAITPGTHPQSQSKKTINTEPHPFPITESGGKKMARSTRQKLIVYFDLIDVILFVKGCLFLLQLYW